MHRDLDHVLLDELHYILPIDVVLLYLDAPLKRNAKDAPKRPTG